MSLLFLSCIWFPFFGIKVRTPLPSILPSLSVPHMRSSLFQISAGHFPPGRRSGALDLYQVWINIVLWKYVAHAAKIGLLPLMILPSSVGTVVLFIFACWLLHNRKKCLFNFSPSSTHLAWDCKIAEIPLFSLISSNIVFTFSYSILCSSLCAFAMMESNSFALL